MPELTFEMHQAMSEALTRARRDWSLPRGQHRKIAHEQGRRADCCPLIGYRPSLMPSAGALPYPRRVICHAEAARRSLAAPANACCVTSSG
jgi:hypothetical protein